MVQSNAKQTKEKRRDRNLFEVAYINGTECSDYGNHLVETLCLLRERLRPSSWYHTSVRSISRIRINCRDYDRWSRSYFAIFLSGARPRRDAANCSQRYLWPSYAHFVASRHFRRLELNRYYTRWNTAVILISPLSSYAPVHFRNESRNLAEFTLPF